MTVVSLDTHRAVVWQQLTTGRVHKRQTCGIARRSRYGTVRREVTNAELAALPKCKRCWP